MPGAWRWARQIRTRCSSRRVEGDESAYGRLVDLYRPELHAHCYRMTGSVHDADDALQDALLRAWKGLPRFEGRSSLRSWFYRIATSLDVSGAPQARAADRLRAGDRSARRAGRCRCRSPSGSSRTRTSSSGSQDGFAAPEARYELRESVELAFVAALQHLPARQRAVLILREVLGYSAKEVADDARHDRRESSTARCSGRGRRSTRSCRSAASRRRCGRSATTSSGSSSTATWTRGSATTSTPSSSC